MVSLSLVIPAYNEGKRLPDTLRSVAAFVPSGRFGPVEVIVIDDGSTDDTTACAEDLLDILELAGARARVLRNSRNRGKGYSVRLGMREAGNDWILLTDADLATPLAEAERLQQAAEEGGHQIAIGSRGLDRSLIRVRQPMYRELAGRLFNLNMRAVMGLDYADTQCGFKLFSREAARKIAARQRVERFGFDAEQLYLAGKLGLSVVEVPVRWNDMPGSSVGLLDGLRAFLDLWAVKLYDLTGRYR